MTEASPYRHSAQVPSPDVTREPRHVGASKRTKTFVSGIALLSASAALAPLGTYVACSDVHGASWKTALLTLGLLQFAFGMAAATLLHRHSNRVHDAAGTRRAFNAKMPTGRGGRSLAIIAALVGLCGPVGVMLVLFMEWAFSLLQWSDHAWGYHDC